MNSVVIAKNARSIASKTRGTPRPNNLTGKNTASAAPGEQPGLDTPEEIARAVVAAFGRSVAYTLDGCELISQTFVRFEGNHTALARFGNELANGRLIDRVGVDGLGSVKLSMFRKVGDKAPILRHPQILAHVHGGYSTYYQLVLLLEAMDGNVDGLVSFLESNAGQISRRRLEEEKDRIIAEKREAARRSSGPRNNPGGSSKVNGQNSGRPLDFLLITPTDEDIRRLAQDYPDVDRAPRCLRLHKAVAQNATAALITSVKDLPIVGGKLLPYCGFERIAQVMLAQMPTTPDLTDVKIIVTAERVKGSLGAPLRDDWEAVAKFASDPKSIASSLAPKSLSRMHLFAASAAEGWNCVLEQEAWNTRADDRESPASSEDR